MRIVSIVGARPQFVKLAPIVRACDRAGVDHVIVHTGQHYDPLLSDIFFSELGIPAPHQNLGVGSGTQATQTAHMLEALGHCLPGLNPDWVLVFGDTNSTVAAALAAVKLHLRVAHLEAGLRSFDRRMPEEINRVLTDHAADLLLAPTQVAADHLTTEGLRERTRIVGDVMTDVLLHQRNQIVTDQIPSSVGSKFNLADGTYTIATIHRAENTDDPTRLAAIVECLRRVDHPVVLLAHPRLVARAEAAHVALSGGSLLTHPPLGYRELVASVMRSRGVITDSGGLQKEAFLLRVPTTTVRPVTEWVETVQLGWNVLVEPGAELLAAATRPRPAPVEAAPYGYGHAAQRVIEVLAEENTSSSFYTA